MDAELHKLISAEQRIIYEYQLQRNGLVERQNRAIKNSLVNVLENNLSKWGSLGYPVPGLRIWPSAPDPRKILTSLN